MANASEVILRGQRAKALLEDDMLRGAFTSAREKFTRQWEKAETVEARERCHALISALEEVEGQLRKVMDAGTLEQRRQDAAPKRGSVRA